MDPGGSNYISGMVSQMLQNKIRISTWKFWLSICVETSIPESQQPYPGWEWYQPMAFSRRPTLQGESGWNHVNRYSWPPVLLTRCMRSCTRSPAPARSLESLCLPQEGQKSPSPPWHWHPPKQINVWRIANDDWCSPVAVMLFTNLSQQQPHDLQVATWPSMHHHLQQRQGRDLDILERKVNTWKIVNLQFTLKKWGSLSHGLAASRLCCCCLSYL